METKELIDKLEIHHTLTAEEWKTLLLQRDDNTASYAAERAVAVRRRIYGDEVYVRGLIEFTNYCKNDCYYCGIRTGNKNADRYHLTESEILDCCAQGYELGFRTFVLQGGEDPHLTDEYLCTLVQRIKDTYPDCAVTLSVGERSKESYRALYKAGADRYLLRHETADPAHYERLHPAALCLDNRKRCLYDLKEIGFQVGAGFMVGSPYQTTDCLVEDLLFLKELSPQMAGIGPFIPHADTPFSDRPAGSLEQTLFLLSLIRLMLPQVLLPATTALATIHPQGRELGLLAGANVVMPNLSPRGVREKYKLYDGKVCTGEEAAECMDCLQKRINSVGCRIVVDRGDYKKETESCTT